MEMQPALACARGMVVQSPSAIHAVSRWVFGVIWPAWRAIHLDRGRSRGALFMNSGTASDSLSLWPMSTLPTQRVKLLVWGGIHLGIPGTSQVTDLNRTVFPEGSPSSPSGSHDPERVSDSRLGLLEGKVPNGSRAVLRPQHK